MFRKEHRKLCGLGSVIISRKIFFHNGFHLNRLLTKELKIVNVDKPIVWSGTISTNQNQCSSTQTDWNRLFDMKQFQNHGPRMVLILDTRSTGIPKDRLKSRARLNLLKLPSLWISAGSPHGVSWEMSPMRWIHIINWWLGLAVWDYGYIYIYSLLWYLSLVIGGYNDKHWQSKPPTQTTSQWQSDTNLKTN